MAPAKAANDFSFAHAPPATTNPVTSPKAIPTKEEITNSGTVVAATLPSLANTNSTFQTGGSITTTTSISTMTSSSSLGRQISLESPSTNHNSEYDSFLYWRPPVSQVDLSQLLSNLGLDDTTVAASFESVTVRAVVDGSLVKSDPLAPVITPQSTIKVSTVGAD